MALPEGHCLVTVFHHTSFLRFQIDDGGAGVPASLQVFIHATGMGFGGILPSQDRVDGGHFACLSQSTGLRRGDSFAGKID